VAVASGDRTTVRPEDMVTLLQAQRLMDQHLDVTAILKQQLLEARKNPRRGLEALALDRAIAARFDPQGRY
jgi:hypothetical protein